MTTNINKLLSKKGYTGEEVGRALIASLMNDLQYREDGETAKPLFTEGEFSRMENSLEGERDFTAYGLYIEIHNSILQARERLFGQVQQFYHGYYRNFTYLRTAMNAERAEEEENEMRPLIMTRKQYEGLKKEVIDTKRAWRESYYSAFFSVLQDALELKPGKLPADLAQAIEETEKEKVTNPRILANYAEDTGDGYYTLPDGRRSDEMSSEEWRKATEDLITIEPVNEGDEVPDIKELMFDRYQQRHINLTRLFYEGADSIRKRAKELSGNPHALDDFTDEELLDYMEELIEGGIDDKGDRREPKQFLEQLEPADFVKMEWHYSEPPADLTKYDILTECLKRYSGGWSDRLLEPNGEFTEEISERAQFAEFVKDYPAVYKALSKYLSEKVPLFGKLRPSQYFEPVISCGELADLGVIGYPEYIQAKDANILELYNSKNGKSGNIFRGIAIIQNPLRSQLTDEGNFEPDTRLNFSSIVYGSLKTISEDEEDRKWLDMMKNEHIIPALKYITQYEATLKILAEVYGLGDVTNATLPPEVVASITGQIDAYNGLLYSFYYGVHGNKEQKKEKRELIKELFSPFYLDEYQPSKESVKAVKRELEELGMTASARTLLKDGFARLINKLDSWEAENGK